MSLVSDERAKSILPEVYLRTLILIILISSIFLLGCEPDDPGEENPNRVPETRLSNIPPDSITSTSPLLALSWLGDDPDGFVTAYRYTWTFQPSPSDPVEKNPAQPKSIANPIKTGFILARWVIDGEILSFNMSVS